MRAPIRDPLDRTGQAFRSIQISTARAGLSSRQVPRFETAGGGESMDKPQRGGFDQPESRAAWTKALLAPCTTAPCFGQDPVLGSDPRHAGELAYIVGDDDQSFGAIEASP